jgi:hypothetical protein
MSILLRNIVIAILGLLSIVISGCQNQSTAVYTPGLGEIMTMTQMRHIKLWFAGSASNWQLADYQLHELEEGFEDAIKFHPKRTELLPQKMGNSLAQLKAAISAKNNTDFKHAFMDLTNSCNACHTAVNNRINVVITPTLNLYTNQNFEVLHQTDTSLYE